MNELSVSVLPSAPFLYDNIQKRRLHHVRKGGVEAMRSEIGSIIGCVRGVTSVCENEEGLEAYHNNNLAKRATKQQTTKISQGADTGMGRSESTGLAKLGKYYV